MSPSFRKPTPGFALMWILGLVNRWLLLKGAPVLRRIPVVRDVPFVRGHFRIRKVDFPLADRARLHEAVNTGTAAFIGPNHPEFGFDWMMDKELSTFVSPKMASWASHEIVATAPWFWLRNNLISHNGGAAAAQHSVAWARRGYGVLLHPEGSVHWTADRIHPLYDGIAEMACEAARRGVADREDRPVYIVPIVWKLRYVGDVSARLHAEMNYVERHLGLDLDRHPNIAEHFRLLQDRVLTKQMLRFGFDSSSVARLDFFSRQETFRQWLIDDLISRYSVEQHDSLERTLARCKRAISAERRAVRHDGSDRDRTRRTALTFDLERVEEASRLGGFSREAYSTRQLSQEQIGESLKRLRATLVTAGLRNSIHNLLPVPFGPRVAHVRVPASILIDPSRASASGDARQAYVASLIDLARRRMQEGLDSISAEIAPEVDLFSIPNPFFIGSYPAGRTACSPAKSMNPLSVSATKSTTPISSPTFSP
jgi:hypothetical protein